MIFRRDVILDRHRFSRRTLHRERQAAVQVS
jgi:hypothetical protein